MILPIAWPFANSCLVLLHQVARLHVAERGPATHMLRVLIFFLVSLYSYFFLEFKLAT